ncbi:ankyrin repeat-containing domain protein [Bisporella sp. PMI_857]|nr:ankyrin repeat-containing domain protein [Bisporella sp. PMI_857]
MQTWGFDQHLHISLTTRSGCDEKSCLSVGCLTAGSDWTENQNFTVLHKIVIGLSFQSLDEALVLYRDGIDAVDALGRTPLTWAAAREDEKADPNTPDIQWTGPVSYAAERGYIVCVRLLLEVGRCPDPIIPGNLKIGSPLNCAARNSANAFVLKTLLDFGAGADASEYGANINAADITSYTPLTTAITYNSHNVLQLFLDRCSRVADLETLKILVATDHFGLKYNKDYILADCMNRVRDRCNVDDQILAAFQDLVSVISGIREMAESGLSRLEAGLLMYKDSPLMESGMSGC